MIYDVSYKNLIGAKPLLIMFKNVYGFIRDYDGTKYLVLFGTKRFDAIFDRIRYVIRLENGIIYVDSCNYGKSKIDSDNALPL